MVTPAIRSADPGREFVRLKRGLAGLTRVPPGSAEGGPAWHYAASRSSPAGTSTASTAVSTGASTGAFGP